MALTAKRPNKVRLSIFSSARSGGFLFFAESHLDIYLVQFEKAKVDWRVASLTNGRIYGMLAPRPIS